MDDYEKELKKLEKDLKIDEVKVKKRSEAKVIEAKDKDLIIEKKKKKVSGWVQFKKKWLRTTPKKGQPKVEVDESISATVVNLPFDYWAGTRHEMWKLSDDESSKLSTSFQKAIGPYLPYILKQYFPVISFGALFFRIVETKRKQEARLALDNKLAGFSPKRRKKILKSLQKKKASA